MDEKEQLVLEYYDCIMTCELSVAMARKFGEYENKALRSCCKMLAKRIKNDSIRRIIKGVQKANYPVGALAKIRREFDEACG